VVGLGFVHVGRHGRPTPRHIPSRIESIPCIVLLGVTTTVEEPVRTSTTAEDLPSLQKRAYDQQAILDGRPAREEDFTGHDRVVPPALDWPTVVYFQS
jgi:hypothetical protein